ncbi:unnamed protein product [Brassica rapa subsp. trilocularis]
MVTRQLALVRPKPLHPLTNHCTPFIYVYTLVDQIGVYSGGLARLAGKTVGQN